MDNQYTALANKIKTYLKNNNISDFTKEEYEKKYENFYKRFSPEVLANLTGKDVRDKIFSHDSDRNNLCYVLESSKEYKKFCGGIGGGSAYKFSLFKKKDTRQWTTGSSLKNKVVDDEESIKIATQIRDAIVNGANYIRNANLSSVDDYARLGKKLEEIFEDCPANPINSWIHKYYSLIFPEYIVMCHQSKMKKDMIKKFHLEPLKEYYDNDGQLYQLSKEAGIKLSYLFEEDIVGLFYESDGDVWSDFDKRKLIDDDTVRYWAYAPGERAYKWDLFYEKGVMGVGWNYIGDLNQYNNTKEDADRLSEIIFNKERKRRKLKQKNSSAAHTLLRFAKEIKPGDYVFAKEGNKKIIGFGKVTSSYYYDTSIDTSIETPDRENYYHYRDITWLKKGEWMLKKPFRGQFTLKELEENYAKEILEIIGVDKIENNRTKDNLERNLIYFGAPGTGKSYTLNKDKDNLISSDDCYERVTFHPDYSYANFVGTYKPVSTENGISYDYVPGPFMRTLVKAYRNPDEKYLLVIEEINRANVASVFGDVFQLLDRNKDGSSRYPIETSEDIRKYLEKELREKYSKISIPGNMFIWATMNSADQGVFPMDTAFKRRWKFKYFGIDNNEELIEDLVVNLNGVDIYWNDLRKAINEELLTYKINEDKLIGPFFAFEEHDSNIDVEEFRDTFKNKILMYLFEDVARSKRNLLFSGVNGNGNYVYSRICDEFDEKGVEIFCNNISDQFIDEDEE